MEISPLKIVALSGGVGGAKFADGLSRVVQPNHLTVIVNTGDDFSYLGLRISPDLDTVCYTLAGLANPGTGWGRDHETWHAFENMEMLGFPAWFRLGDADLATHLVRTQRLSSGIPLSQVTRDFCSAWGVKPTVLPMTDDNVQTWVFTNEGDLEFQDYFVHRRCEPVVKGFKFAGAEKSRPAPGVLAAIEQCDAVVICPSNPWVSVDPILAVPGILDAIKNRPVYAVSPILGAKTVKGPAAKMFSELGIQPSALAVAGHYRELLDGLLVHRSDERLAGKIHELGLEAYPADILMHTVEDRGRLAGELLDIIEANLRG